MVWLDVAPSCVWEVYGNNDDGNDNDEYLYYFPSLVFQSDYINII